MGSRSRTHHRLSSGMVVSGPPEQPKERALAGSSGAPYTGSDVKKSRELGRIFDIPVVVDPSKSQPPNNSTGGGSGRSASYSGPLSRPSSTSTSGALPPQKTSSGPLSANLPATGLIIGGPTRRSGGQGSQQGDQTPRSKKKSGGYGPAVTILGKENALYGFRIPKLAVWSCVVVFALGLAVGMLMLVAVKNAAILVALGALLVLLGLLVLWNWARKPRHLEGYLRSCPDTNLLWAKTGEFVKVTGVVTCGSIPLETSYQGVSRCVYVFTELHEYRGWSGKPANHHHKCLTWGLRHEEVLTYIILDANPSEVSASSCLPNHQRCQIREMSAQN